jgi:phosphoadenosine phosphosulfate reductase
MSVRGVGGESLDEVDRAFWTKHGFARVEWALSEMPGPQVIASAFAPHAAVLLHMVVSRRPAIPVVLVDVGGLNARRQRFVEELVGRLELDLRIDKILCTADAVASTGSGSTSVAAFAAAPGRTNAIAPLARTLRALRTRTWYTDLHSPWGAAQWRFVTPCYGAVRVCPLADWSPSDALEYLRCHDLPVGPL